MDIPKGLLSKEFLSQFKSQEDVSNFMKELHTKVFEELLQVEMDEHLGYEKHSKDGGLSGNSRNSKYRKRYKENLGKRKLTYLEPGMATLILLYYHTAISYDFTTAANKAYGNNMKSMTGGVFALYAGDVNQDGSINTVDEGFVTDANFGEGYSIYDLDGNGMVDNGDVSFVSANVRISFLHP